MAMKNITKEFTDLLTTVNSPARYAILQTPNGFTPFDIEHMIQATNDDRNDSGKTKTRISPEHYLIIRNWAGIETIDPVTKMITYDQPTLFSISTWFKTDAECRELFATLAEIVNKINYYHGEPIHAEYSTNAAAFNAAVKRRMEYPKTVPINLKGNHEYWRNAYFEPDDDDDDDDIGAVLDDDEADERYESRRERLADIRAYYYDR